MFNRFNKRSFGTKKFLKLTKTSSWVHCLRELGLKLKTDFYVAFPRKQSSSISRILTILWFFLDVKCLVMLEPSFELCRCENNHYVRLDDHVADVVDVVDVADVCRRLPTFCGYYKTLLGFEFCFFLSVAVKLVQDWSSNGPRLGLVGLGLTLGLP